MEDVAMVVASEVVVEVVKYFVPKMIQKVREHIDLTEEAEAALQKLNVDIDFLTEYLKEAAAAKSNNVNVVEKALLRDVRDNVYKAEDAIDSLGDTQRRWKWFRRRPIPTPSTSEAVRRIQAVAESVGEIRSKIEDFQGTQLPDPDAFPLYEGEPPGQDEYCPIFVEDEERLKQLVRRDEAKQPDMILISGARGIGKTTLAAKIFRSSEIGKFTRLIWVRVSYPTTKNIFLVVLRLLDPDAVPKDIPFELRIQVRSLLENEKYLLVLDDVAEMSGEDHEELRMTIGGSDNGSKVLITSDNRGLAHFVKKDSHVELKRLKQAESLDLLKLRLYSGNSGPSEFQCLGQFIADSCNGLPRDIVWMAEALTKKLLLETQESQVWEDISRGIVPFKVPSYSELPYDLKLCFLYMAIYPRQSKLRVSKLIQMWIAEGFIPRRQNVTLEKTAETYLEELVEKNLVKIEEKRVDGSAKTCCITKSAHEFCKRECAEENFLQEIIKSDQEGFFPLLDEVKEHRRICIHDHISEFMPKFISDFEICLRSFVSHSEGEYILHKNDVSKILAAFKLLRVLDAKPIKVNKFHRKLCMLFHLRYIILSLNADVLPKAISKLRNVQTLIVHSSSRILKIEADLLRMHELRHLQTDASATFPKQSDASEKNERLHTLYGISPKSCTTEFFSKVPYLKKLGICGQLALLLLDSKKDVLSKLDNVEKLKLLNQEGEEAGGKKRKLWRTTPKHEGVVTSLILQTSRFPPKLKSLTLSATSLDWEDISMLGSLPELKELRLKDNAFLGEKWEVRDNGLPNIQTLKIESLNFEQWECSSTHFPQLKRLILSKCNQLNEIPIALADIQNFEELHLHDGTTDGKESARRIDEKKQERMKTDVTMVFNLLLT